MNNDLPTATRALCHRVRELLPGMGIGLVTSEDSARRLQACVERVEAALAQQEETVTHTSCPNCGGSGGGGDPGNECRVCDGRGYMEEAKADEWFKAFSLLKVAEATK